MIRSRFVLAASTALAVLATACSDASQSAPSARTVAPQQPSLSAGAAASVAHSARRARPLSHDVRATVTIDAQRGGTLSVPEAGLTVVVPPGALPAGQSSLELSVTAYAGSQLAYEFEPSGTQFTRPITVRQDIAMLADAGLLGTRRAPELGYFRAKSDLHANTGTAQTYERLVGSVATGTDIAFDVWHFSGYIVVWGIAADAVP